MSKLKIEKCPFCGSEIKTKKIYLTRRGHAKRYWTWQCSKSQCDIKTSWTFKTEAEAVEHANRRDGEK